ncbi:histone-lysine N-methyltransferase SUVR5 [Lactuca sativa]|uniref:histone-lysine N-methyltransferase SUVR5 n=1 Tax=Lactuca sativa TaxID=4236 RepID=UPI000CC2573C|nr:histone-lysine N-methyltransferase SUVR5 [Lactuca sativa]
MQVLPRNGPDQGSEKAFVYDGGSNNVKHELVDGTGIGIGIGIGITEASDDDQKLSSNTHDSGVDSLELACGNQECESEPKWLEQDQPMAVWVKWRGKWQAGIRCARSDWPLSTIRAKPTHERKQYLVIFFPRKRNYSWADVLLLRPINEFPEPIAYRSHNIGVKIVKDLIVARRFIMQKIAVTLINTIEQLTTEGLKESARSVVVWKDFALEASRCKDYSDLGNMLLKLENMILQRFIDSFWLEHSKETWVQKCQNAQTAESIELLKEELGEAINWNEVQTLTNTPEIVTEWKTLKPEIMKWFSISNPSFNNGESEQQNDGFSNTSPQVSRKRPKLEVRRASQLEPEGVNPSFPVETDSRFFNGPVRDDKWGEIVVETGNQETRFNDRNKQCTAFIEAKGRRCVRWANDGDVFCCVHLASRFSTNHVRTDVTPQLEPQMCEGTTVLGTKCKHRSLPGTSFCKKHRINKDKDVIVISPPIPENKTIKRKVEDVLLFEGGNNCQEIVVSGHFRNEENLEGVKCIGDNEAVCNESPTKHTLYCEKHLPNWLKRARNGKSRIVSKEVFIELLKSCESHVQKRHLHQACELFYRFFKSVLSLRSPVPKEIQLQWVMSEASKDVNTRYFLFKLVCSEKERLIRLFGFDGKIPENSENTLLEAHVENDDGSDIKCSVCSLKFLDDQMLSKHFIENHKKEARVIFKQYVCAICFDTFSENTLLEGHVLERHHVQFVDQCMLYQCIPCGNRFGNSDQLWSHVVSNHPANFKGKNVISDHHNNNNNQGGFQKYICRFCGLKFDLLPDLGRHHQAAHMGSNSNSNPSGTRVPKRGVPFFSNKLKPGRLNRPRFKKGLRKKHIQAPFQEIIESESQFQFRSQFQSQSPESVILGRLQESECANVAKLLYSKINKTKLYPGNLEILAMARSVCCRKSFQASMEKKYGVLPERLYLKAAKLCSEHNVLIEWHQERFVCPKGCDGITDSDQFPPLTKTESESTIPIPTDVLGPKTEAKESRVPDPVTGEWAMDESHYIINFSHSRPESEKAIVLCDDISFGMESVQIACVVDDHLLGSIHNSADGDDGQTFLPWENFTYITKPLLDKSLDFGLRSLQLGCGCAHSTCSPKGCDHVYLFDNDYEDAKDINGKSMKGRFPYDDQGRIILEEGYLVYECNKNCSCNKNCPNRVLQNGVKVKLEVFKTEDKGWGVRAGEPIDRGTFICEYIGEVVDEHEAKKRRHRYDREGCGFIYEIDARINDMIRLIEGEAPYAIDATKFGNVSRYINHSCSPNLENHQVLIESLDSELSHIGLYASRDIAPGEELSFDYMNKAPPGKGCQCKCGAVNCRGRLH